MLHQSLLQRHSPFGLAVRSRATGTAGSFFLAPLKRMRMAFKNPEAVLRPKEVRCRGALRPNTVPAAWVPQRNKLALGALLSTQVRQHGRSGVTSHQGAFSWAPYPWYACRLFSQGISEEKPLSWRSSPFRTLQSQGLSLFARDLKSGAPGCLKNCLRHSFRNTA